jgi:uroporphyrinogen-III synthase
MVKVINTRPADRNGDQSRLLRQAGFEPLEIPCVDIESDEEGLKRIRALSPAGYTGIFLSSPNGLKHMQEGLLSTEFERWAMKPFHLVGPAARPRVEAAGGQVAFVPEEASLEGFLKEYRPAPGPGLPLAQRWLHPCSASTRLDPAAFKAKGIRVENMPVYRPAAPKDLSARLPKEARDAFAVIFCSGSAVENYFSADPEGAALLGRPKGPLAVSIGASTSKALQDKGVPEIRQALHADDASLVDVP